MKRHVSAELDVDITAPTTLEFQIAVAPHPQAEVSESFSFVLDEWHIETSDVTGMHGNRIYKFDAPLGNLQVNYTATIVGQADRAPVTEYDLSMYLRVLVPQQFGVIASRVALSTHKGKWSYASVERPLSWGPYAVAITDTVPSPALAV